MSAISTVTKRRSSGRVMIEAPHSAQKRAPSGAFAPQEGQVTMTRSYGRHGAEPPNMMPRDQRREARCDFGQLRRRRADQVSTMTTSQPLPSRFDPPLDFTAFELLTEPIAVVDIGERECVFRAANAAVRTLLACNPVGREITSALAGVADEELALLLGAIESGKSQRSLVERGGCILEFEARPQLAQYVVLFARDVTERESLAARVAHDARHDAITGLPNGECLVDRIAATIARPELLGAGAAVVICDLDQYRTISDGLGPAACADLLRSIGERFERTLRFGDCVARLVGDEFAVFCCDVANAEQAREVAERLLDTLAEPVELESGEVFVSATVGIALLDDNGDTSERVMRDAHAALSSAKAQGRGSVSVFDAAIRERVVERIEIEKALHRALREGEFRVFYQPLVRFSGTEVIGFEALVRWAHPERGLVAPMEFIPIAEENGLIVPIGEWVLREVCHQAAQWSIAVPGAEPLVVSVNLSARQLAHPDLVATVADALGQSGIDPSMLLVEVTESTLMSDPELATTILHALRSLGVRIAVDDFGTGHSSLGYLKHLPVDCLKIDRSFVSGLGVDPDDRAIVGAVVSMGHALGLTVTAEGVETTQQLDELESLGCDVGQGFYFAKPQPGEVVTALVRHRFSWRRAA
jgi:diguanylate cyclase (GGDEF)-like protein